jgi:hypothetical protein
MRHEDDAPVYEATPIKCWACERREIAMRDAIESNRGQPLAGWHWLITEQNGGA